MSRLLNPGLGDLVDRWTILDLKIADAKRRGVDHGRFAEEQLGLNRLIRDRGLGSLRVLDTAEAKALAQVNAEIWVLQDELPILVASYRVNLDDAPFDVIRRIAHMHVEIVDLNERRAELVRALNNDGWIEKVR